MDLRLQTLDLLESVLRVSINLYVTMMCCGEIIHISLIAICLWFS